VVVPLLYVWGDDDLLAERMVGRFASALATELGMPLERWDARPYQATAGVVAAQLAERLATPVLFGGGTLAVVANPGAIARRNETRDRVVEAIGLLAAGNALVFVEASPSSAKGPGPKRLAEAVAAAGGRVVATQAPRPTALGAWIETEARERGMTLAPGAARELAERLGSRITEGDVDRRFVSRIASMELDKLTLRHATDDGPVTVEDVQALVTAMTPA
jgi:DNA polymerase III delta subunit